MRALLSGLFIILFIAIPLFLLNSVVLPELNELSETYANQGTIVQQLVPQQ